MLVTVFTPTYNRKNEIEILYKSLVNQTEMDFEWLIIDDGSIDHTKELIHSFIQENIIQIRYYYQKNQGKYSAYNRGIELANGNYFFCVDSDDYLDLKAIEIIKEAVDSLNSAYIGAVFPQSLNYDKQKWDFINNTDVDIIDLKELHNIMESAIVIKSDILRKYRFPCFRNDKGDLEKFCSEGILYNYLISEGSFIAKNSVIYYSNYLENGLTQNLFTKTWINNFYSTIADLQSRFNTANKFSKLKSIKVKTKAIMNLNALCIKKGKSIKDNTPSIEYSILLYLPSVIWKIFRFK